jgi:hypothetical protein
MINKKIMNFFLFLIVTNFLLLGTSICSANGLEISYRFTFPLLGGFKYEKENFQPSLLSSNAFMVSTKLDNSILVGASYRADTLAATQIKTSQRNYSHFGGIYNSIGVLAGYRATVTDQFSVDGTINLSNGRIILQNDNDSQSAQISNVWSTDAEAHANYSFNSSSEHLRWFISGNLGLYRIFIPAFSYQNVEYTKEFDGMIFYMMGISAGLQF